MVSARSKGIHFCREVGKILEAMGHEVDGPFYKPKFFNGKINSVHQDVFSIWDLISFFENRYYFHQVSTIENKSTKIKAIQEKGMSGWVWCRVTEDNQTGFDVFIVDGVIIEEKEMRYYVKKGKKKG